MNKIQYKQLFSILLAKTMSKEKSLGRPGRDGKQKGETDGGTILFAGKIPADRGGDSGKQGWHGRFNRYNRYLRYDWTKFLKSYARKNRNYSSETSFCLGSFVVQRNWGRKGESLGGNLHA